MNEKRETKMISAKICPDLFDDIEELKELLRIGTRNEIVERALQFYVSSFHYAAQTTNAINNLKEASKT
jgi:hypothetical protein